MVVAWQKRQSKIQTTVCFVAFTMAPRSCDISDRAKVPSVMKATGGNVKQAAKVLKRCEPFVRLWTERYRRGNRFGNKPRGGRKRKLSAKAAASAKELACGKRKIDSYAIARRLYIAEHIEDLVSRHTIARSLKRGRPEGLCFRALDKRQRLTGTHKAKRVQSANEQKKSNFTNWMWVGSKVFAS